MPNVPEDVAGELAAEMSVEIDPAEFAGFVMTPGHQYTLDKLDTLMMAVQKTHDEEHDEVSQRWCPHQLCRTVEEIR